MIPSSTSNGATRVVDCDATLPRFLIETRVDGFIIRDTLLGSHLSEVYDTVDAAQHYLARRFGWWVELEGVA
jgi:hypothetical protein